MNGHCLTFYESRVVSRERFSCWKSTHGCGRRVLSMVPVWAYKCILNHDELCAVVCIL